MLSTVSTVTNKKSRRPPTVAGLVLVSLLTGCAPTAPGLLKDGERLLQAGRPEQAVAKVEAARDLLPEDARVWNHLGLAYHAAGRSTNAIQAYQKALALDRNLFAARFNLGCLHLEQNDVAAALGELTTFTQMQPEVKDGWLKLATAQVRVRRYDDAERSLTKANARDPAAMNLAGMVQLARRRPHDAQGYFQEALKLQPDYAPAILNLAVTLHQQTADKPAALEKYRAYLALKPRPANWESVNAIVLQLDQELNPPPKSVAPASQVTAVVTQPVARVTMPTATNAVVARTNVPVALVPAPATNTPRTNLPAQPVRQTAAGSIEKTNVAVSTAAVRPVAVSSAPTQKVEVVTLAPEAPIAMAKEPARVPPAKPTASAPVVKDSPAEAPTRTPLLQRLNPVRWFSGSRTEKKNETPIPPSRTEKAKPVTRVENAATNAPAETPSLAAPKPFVFARYQYLRPTRAKPGNRAEAQRFFNAALADHREGRLTQAVTGYLAATQSDPAFYEAHYNLGLAAIELSHFGRALSAYESALSINPTSVDARFNFALALQRADHPRDAANELEKILAEKPGEARAHLTLGNVLAQQLSDTPTARTHYLQFLQLDPGHAQAPAVRSWLVAHP